MKPPCIGCQFEKHDKLAKYVWFPGKVPHKRKDVSRAAKYRPGLNYKNPCYDCKQRERYADAINSSVDYGPTTGGYGHNQVHEY